MATKAPDLGDSCVLFKTFGKCIYGATCRFAGSHFGEDFKNIIDTDLQKQWEGKAVVKNGLSKELQQQLRKKKFPFDKSQEYLRHLSKTSRTTGSGSKASVKETRMPNLWKPPFSENLQALWSGRHLWRDGCVYEFASGTVGGGCALMTRANKFEQIVRGMNYIRTGVQEKTNLAHKIIPSLREWGAALVTLHGRSREQRYTKVADWEYIAECAKIASPMPLFEQFACKWFSFRPRIEPWIFTEIKERRHWDISSSERFEILKDYTNYGLEHWGSDTQGVEKTRKFLLEWLSFLCRYIPAGLLERLPQRINERPPYYMGRDYMETLMASQNVGDWIKISEMLLGPVPTNFTFLPKHKANSYK
ncbi:hypothetical protein JD844_034315 [Phrynosoma platyrhinos]|uniref:tRNA-dihydrouridine(47) synthase [NAD(P)(+)] n=1 Tax=Phrynosoma platyrhinos TaxID=52577 RepID=A0ABQ7T8B5_PHRPL|nr:hypothetical protein JD844_034315 [Phrynosoma platyrhinos]